MEITQFLDHFDSVSDERDGYLARCPGHGDSKPSLKIFVGDDAKVRLTCRAGCDTGDVIRAAGLEWGDLFEITGSAITVPREAPPLVGAGQIAALRVWLDSLPDVSGETGDYAWRRFGLDIDDAERLGVKASWGSDGPAKGFSGVSEGFSSYPRLVVPLTGFDGVTRGVQGRDVTGRCPGRWLSLTNVNGTRWAAYGVLGEASPGRPTIITEGPGDGLTVAALGYRAVIVRGAHLARNAELVAELAAGLADAGVVLVAGDVGSAGETFTDRIIAGLGAAGIDARALPVAGDDDITAWREASPGAFDIEFERAVEAALAEPPAPAEAAVLDRAPVEIDDAEWVRIAETLSRGPDKLVPHVNYATLVYRVAGNVVMNVQGIGWHAWDGVRWVHTADSGAAHRALTHTSNILAARQAEAPQSSEWVTEARAVLLNTTNRNHVVAELGRLPETQATADDLDAQRHLLNFRNGVVDLRDGRLLPHDPAYRMTHVTNVDYVPTAKAPRWERFVNEIHPGKPEVQAYFQRFLGMALSGEVKDHKLGVWYGAQGRNGKGTTVRAMQAAFGHDLVHEIPFSVFESNRDAGNPEKVVAMLRSARMVVAQEGAPDAQIKTHLLRNWSGGDRLTGRHLYEMPITYTPQFTMILATNHLPQFSSGGAALWARTDALLFGESFAGREDRTMEPTLCGPEREGIAAWVVRGAMAYYKGGLRSPQAVVEATEMHKEEVDPLRPLVGEVFEYREGATALRSETNAALKDWREINGDRSGKYSPGSFKRALLQQGVVETRDKKGKWIFKGIALMSDIEAAEREGPGIFAKD